MKKKEITTNLLDMSFDFHSQHVGKIQKLNFKAMENMLKTCIIIQFPF